MNDSITKVICYATIGVCYILITRIKVKYKGNHSKTGTEILRYLAYLAGIFAAMIIGKLTV